AAYLPAAAAARSGVRTVAAAGRDLALVRLEGTGPSVEYRLDVLRELLAGGGAEVAVLEQADSLDLWQELRDVRLIPTEHMLWRLSVPPAAAAGIVRTLSPEVAPDWFADWAGGLLWLGVPGGEDARAGAVRDALAGAGGHATLVRAPAGVRSSVPPFQPEPAPLAALSARVKDSFDPERILNRGRMFESV
ncbi:MAG TPA: glycolate oxidase subunit GlcE, partial [Geminicoccaceae bacterium]